MLAKLKMYTLITISAGAIFVATNAATAWKFYGLGQNNIKAQCDASREKSVSDKLNVKVKQDEVRNAPINNDITDRRLLEGTF